MNSCICSYVYVCNQLIGYSHEVKKFKKIKINKKLRIKGRMLWACCLGDVNLILGSN